MPHSLARLVPYQCTGSLRRNVSNTERWITGVAGAAIAVMGVAQLVRGRFAAADADRQADTVPASRVATALALVAGGTLLARATSGFCPVYALIGRGSHDAEWRARTDIPTTRTLSGNRGFRMRETITIDRPAGEVYSFWRQFENLPRFLRHIRSVYTVDAKHSHWVARGPADTSLEWDAEIVNEEPGKVIGWRTLEGADVASAGSVNFDPTPDGRATKVTVSLQYQPPGGAIGAAVARWFGEEPSQQVREDLRRLKEFMEGRGR